MYMQAAATVLHIPEEALPAGLEKSSRWAYLASLNSPEHISHESTGCTVSCNASFPIPSLRKHTTCLKKLEFGSLSAYGYIELHSFSLISLLLSRLARIFGEENIMQDCSTSSAECICMRFTLWLPRTWIRMLQISLIQLHILDYYRYVFHCQIAVGWCCANSNKQDLIFSSQVH